MPVSATMVKALAHWLASRPRKEPCTTIVLHATAGGSLSGALSTLKLKGLSYHYLIDKDGTVWKAVPYGRVAFHAGLSFGPNGTNVNRYSIGISFVNKNDGVDKYTPAQTDACRLLIADLVEAIPSVEFLTTHYAISPKRKTDPKGFVCAPVANGLTMWRCK